MPLATSLMTEKHDAGRGNSSIRQKLNRILQIDQPKESDQSTNELNAAPEAAKEEDNLVPKVIVRPNPFFTTITLDVTAKMGKHVIVRMFNSDEKVVKMFSWFLVKGINITNIGEVDVLPIGLYSLDIVDLEGTVLYSTKLSKG